MKGAEMVVTTVSSWDADSVGKTGVSLVAEKEVRLEVHSVASTAVMTVAEIGEEVEMRDSLTDRQADNTHKVMKVSKYKESIRRLERKWDNKNTGSSKCMIYAL